MTNPNVYPHQPEFVDNRGDNTLAAAPGSCAKRSRIASGASWRRRRSQLARKQAQQAGRRGNSLVLLRLFEPRARAQVDVVVAEPAGPIRREVEGSPVERERRTALIRRAVDEGSELHGG